MIHKPTYFYEKYLISTALTRLHGNPYVLFRRRLSAEGAKPESNNRCKSELGHVCVWVCVWVCVCVWYLELSPEPRHLAQWMKHQNFGLSRAHCLGTITFFYSSHVVLSAHAQYIFCRYFVIFPIPLDRLSSNLLRRVRNRCVALCASENHVTHFAHAQ